MTYIVIIILLLYFGRQEKLYTLVKKKHFMCIFSLLFILLIGLRCIQTGQDTVMYGAIYSNLNQYNSFSSFISNYSFENSIEYGYATWQWIVNLLFDYRGFLVCQAILMITPFVYVVYKWSDNVVWSFVLYILLGYLTWNMCAARQAPAVSFTLLAYYFYSCKRYKACIVSYLISISFHTTALLFFPAVLIYKLLRNKKLLLISLVASKIIGNYFIPMILPYMRIDYSDDVLSGSVGQLTYFGFLAVLLYCLFIEKVYKVVLPNTFYMFSVMLILWPLVDTIAAAFRITFYFMIYLCFAIPTILNELRDKKLEIARRLFLFSVSIIFSVYFYNMNLKQNGGRHVQPYYSVFEYSDNETKNLYKD